MCQEKKEEKDISTLMLASMHQYGDSKNIKYSTKKHGKNKKKVYKYFKRQNDAIPNEKTWTRLKKGKC